MKTTASPPLASWRQAAETILARLPPRLRYPLTYLRGRLASAVFLMVLKSPRPTRWLPLVTLVMPKRVGVGGDLHFARRWISRLVDAAPPERLKATIVELADLSPQCLWPAVLAAECGPIIWDNRFAASLLSALHARGAQLPKVHAVQLAALVADEGASPAAISLLETYRASRAAAGRERSLDAEICLIRANATRDDDRLWASHVREFFVVNELSPPALPSPPRQGASRFDRLAEGEREAPVRTAGPLVSIIVTCFKAEPYVRQALRSLQLQTHANLEILVVDDCSPDASAEIVGELARTDPRIRLLRNRKNVGTYVSRNRAMRLARGVYVTTQDADDWSHPERIERQIQLLERNARAVASYCVGVRMSLDGQFELRQPGRLLDSMCYPSLLYRRSAALGMIGYWDCVRVEADSEYLTRLTRLYGKKVVTACLKPLVVQLRRENSLTTMAATRLIGSVGQDRQDYRRAVRDFHRGMTRTSGRFDIEDWHRPFPAPDGISVPDDLVREALTWN